MAVELLEHGAVLKTYPMGPCSAIISEAAHVCTQREGDPAKDKAFVKQLMKMRHWSPFEFVALSWDTITNRAVANEIVRHRLASYMQESQRYIRYNNLPVVMPVGVKKKGALARGVWKFGQWVSFVCYHLLLKLGVAAEDARTNLTTATATHMFIAMNLRQFRHFLSLRTDKPAWREMRILANLMAEAFAKQFPDEVYLISDVWHKEGE